MGFFDMTDYYVLPTVIRIASGRQVPTFFQTQVFRYATYSINVKILNDDLTVTRCYAKQKTANF